MATSSPPKESRTAGDLVPGRRELSDLQFALVVALPVLAFLIIVVAYPLGYAMWMSVHRIVFFGGYRASFVGLDNFAKVLESKAFWWSSWVSIRFAAESVLLAMGMGLGLALVLNRRLPLSGLVRTLVILPWCVSLYGAGIMFANLARGQTGIGTSLLNAFGGTGDLNLLNRDTVIEVLAVGNAWTMAPFVALFLLAVLKTIPKRLYDLAAIDRMTPFETFRHVTLPPLRFSLFVFTSITTVLSLKLFDFVFVLSGGGPGTASAVLTYEIYKESFKDLDLGYGAALSFMLLALILLSTFLLWLVWGRRESAA